MNKYRDKIFAISVMIAAIIFRDKENRIFSTGISDVLLVLVSAYHIYYSINSISKINKDDSLIKRIGARLLYYPLLIAAILLIIFIVKQNVFH